MNTGMKLTGIPMSPGKAMGKAFVYHEILDRQFPMYKLNPDQIENEHKRIRDAIDSARQDLRLSAERVEKEMGTQISDIFMAQEMMLMDAALVEELRHEVKSVRVNAEYVVKNVFSRWEQRFAAMSSPILKERADDMLDLCRRILRALSGIQVNLLEGVPAGSVIVAKTLLPSETILLTRQTTVAVIVEFGGRSSHAALLTRQMGIPAVAQIYNLLNQVKHDNIFLVDGSAGEVILSPSDEERKSFEDKIHGYIQGEKESRRHCHEEARTENGIVVKVMANVSCREDVEMACEYGADGVGLHRLESFYIARKILPSEDELFVYLKSTLEPIKEKPITVRLLDIGADKDVPYLNLSEDPIPVLGRRGIRVFFEYPELLRTQIRALLRLCRTMDIRILVPMVTLVEDMNFVRECLKTEAKAMGITELPQLGAMIETPAAALCAKDICACSDFLSVGTNDLTQYTMAAGRENQLTLKYFDDCHPAILKLLQIMFQGVKDCPVSLCGEVAGNKDVIPELLSIGFRTLSVAPVFIPIIKDAVRRYHSEPH